MSIWRLIVQEIRHRKLTFGLGLLSVTAAVGCLVGALTLLGAHDAETDRILEQRRDDVARRIEDLENDYRKITKNMGFNVMILPADQNLGDLFADDYATKFMPYEYAHRLAESKVMTINHLLPVLQERIVWPEQKRTILLTGTEGQIPLLHRAQKSPIQEAVPKGKMVIGHELAASLELDVGDKMELMGEAFEVHKIHPRRGSKDDITIWIDLQKAQQMLDREGKINAIFALECDCEGDRLGQIRAEISSVLPDTQVIEFATKAIARAEARDRAAEEARLALQEEQQNREALRGELESFASVLVPVVIAGCILWLALLSLSNVRSRRTEIGILRAIGVRSGSILGLFLGKAVLIGLVGAVLGVTGGLAVAAGWASPSSAETASPFILFSAGSLAAVLICAPLLSVLASWAPALLAASQDPAVVLHDE